MTFRKFNRDILRRRRQRNRRNQQRQRRRIYRRHAPINNNNTWRQLARLPFQPTNNLFENQIFNGSSFY
jgi:hypothetical protein